MIKLKITIFLFCISSLFSNEKEETSKLNVFEIHLLSEISKDQPKGTLYFFDIDDTLIDFPFMLGSKAWRTYFLKATENEYNTDWHDRISLLLTREYPIIPIEKTTVNLIHELQDKGYPVYGLTARERAIWYTTPTANVDELTASQLKSISIDFSKQPKETFKLDESISEYYKGILFADIEPKGNYLVKLFKTLNQKPVKVIFVDDKKSQCLSMAEALSQLKIPYECYWYVATNEKALGFDPLIANIQLQAFLESKGQKRLSDEEAKAIAKQNPDKKAEDYLLSILKIETLVCP
jgi:hypothetical protein